MARVHVTPGVCGFSTRITAQADAAYNVALEIESDCKLVSVLAATLTQVSAFEEVSPPLTGTATYRAAAEHKLHCACPVPSAIIKAVEVAAGLALPADIHMEISKD